MSDSLPAPASCAVFLSYASQDAETAKRICDSLRAAGIVVWFDQSELVGGDAWDAKIRGQIASCALFVPLISSATQARLEGYFRLEWKLAAQRTHTMADEKTFLLPVVIDATRDAEAKVPVEFKTVQWTKLPGGETPEKFCVRVKQLLSGESGTRLLPGPGHHGQDARATPKVGRRVPAVAWAIASVVAVAAVTFLWQRRNETASPPNAGAGTRPPATEKSAAAALSDAQQLVAKARTILADGDELNREIYSLAEDLAKRAIERDPAEASAWVLLADVSYVMVWQGFDLSATRQEAMRRQAERARSLAPESTEAQLVFANVRTVLRQDLPDVLRDLLALAAREPGDWRVQRALGQAYRFLNRAEESIAALQRACALSPKASSDLANLLIRRNRYAEAEKVVAEALAGQATGRLRVFDVLMKVQWRGDPASATAALAAWPDWLRREDRGAFQAWRAWLWHGQPDKALAAAQAVAREYLHDTFFVGPRAVLTAQAHERAGHSETAKADWRTVVQLVERELASSPDDVAAWYWKAWALARLGDQAGAQAIGTQIRQRNIGTVRISSLGETSLAALWVTIGQPDLAFAELSTQQNLGVNMLVTRAMLELDPAYEPLRTDPRFPALLRITAGPENQSAAAHDSKSIAVLAFANLSDDKANEYFSDGISEELLNVLAKVPGLKVTARTSAFHFKGKDTPIPEIAKQLGVAFVVEGSVRKAGNQVRITAQLIKATDGFHVWSDTFTRELKDIFAVQDEIAGLIAKKLSVQMGVITRVEHQVNPEALALLLEGRHFWALRSNDGFARAGELFSQAVKLDPQWAATYAALASLQSIQASYWGDRGDLAGELYASAKQVARRALELDPNLGEPYAALGHMAMDELNWSESAGLFAKALTLEPNNATAHDWNADLLSGGGRLDDALAGYRRALELDPLSPFILWDVAWFLMHAQRYAEALPLIERATGLTPSGSVRLGVRRAYLLMKLGRRDEAGAVLLPALPGLRLGQDGYLVHEAIACLQTIGRPDEAKQLAADLLRRLPNDPSNGFILTAIGRADEAYPYLERTRPIMRQIIFWDPMLDPLRENPRFQQVLVKLHLTEEYKVARVTLARMLKAEAAKK